MAQFLIKLVNHFASEVITKRLANSRAFQQLAMRTHLKVEQTKKMADNPEEAAKLMRGAGEKVKAEADSVASSFERFKAALKEEVAQGGGSATSSSSSSGKSTGAAPRNGSRSDVDDIAARVQRRRRR